MGVSMVSNLNELNGWLSKQGVPPRSGLVFDRQKHRWVRPEGLEVSTKPKRGGFSIEDIGNEDRKIGGATFKEHIQSAIKHRYLPDKVLDGKTIRELKHQNIISRHSMGYGYVVEQPSVFAKFFNTKRED